MKQVNASLPDMDDVKVAKLFDDKVALSASYSYDGDNNGEHWRRKVRGYWISKCPALLPILDWAEGMDEDEITRETARAEAKSCRWMTELNIDRANEVIWGFLNPCLQDKAHTCFEGAELLNGLEGWRLVVQHIHQGRKVHKAMLRKIVKNPPAITKLEDVAMGITRFENLMKDYKAAGGQLPDEPELKEDLVNTLPQEIRENLLWRASRDEKFSDFKNHIRTTANSMLYHRGKVHPINAIDAQVNEEPGGEYDDEYADELQQAIGAVMRKYGKGKGKGWGGKGGGGFGGAGGAGGGPKGGFGGKANNGGKGHGSQPKCANCGGDHDRRACPKAEVPVSQRPCHGCGEAGHIARFCPNKKQPIKAVDEVAPAPAPAPETSQFGCIDCADCPYSKMDKERMRLEPGF